MRLECIFVQPHLIESFNGFIQRYILIRKNICENIPEDISTDIPHKIYISVQHWCEAALQPLSVKYVQRTVGDFFGVQVRTFLDTVFCEIIGKRVLRPSTPIVKSGS